MQGNFPYTTILFKDMDFLLVIVETEKTDMKILKNVMSAFWQLKTPKVNGMIVSFVRYSSSKNRYFVNYNGAYPRWAADARILRQIFINALKQTILMRRINRLPTNKQDDPKQPLDLERLLDHYTRTQ